MTKAAAKGITRAMKYTCGTCKKDKPREDLLAKRVTFTTLKPVKTIRSRTVGWICSECRPQDPAWTQTAFSAAPGYEGTKYADGE
jgi:hypothetical protein